MHGKELICILENTAPKGWEEIPASELKNRTAGFLGQGEMSRIVDGIPINYRRIESNEQGDIDQNLNEENIS